MPCKAQEKSAEEEFRLLTFHPPLLPPSPPFFSEDNTRGRDQKETGKRDEQEKEKRKKGRGRRRLFPHFPVQSDTDEIN